MENIIDLIRKTSSILLPLGLLYLAASCSGAETQEQLKVIEKALAEANGKIAELEVKEDTGSGDLVHMVFFNLKPEIDPQILIEAIEKLNRIEVVKTLEVGPFENLGDARAMKEYEVVMELSFKDSTAYQLYQKDPVHLELKENTKRLLAGPPLTYDYIKE